MVLRKLYVHKIKGSKKEDKAQDRFILLDNKGSETELEYIRNIYVDEHDEGSNKSLISF